MIPAKYDKGSEWRKWDLHLHSPNTFLNNMFSRCTEDDYVNAVLDAKLKVAGYTNYFKFHENDKKIIDLLKRNGVTVFPNLEFRIDQKNKDAEYIHLHIIFSNLTNWEHIQGFLGRLKTLDNKFCKDLSLEEIQNTVLSLNTIRDALHAEPNLKLFEDYVLAASPRGQGSYRPGMADGRGNTVAQVIDDFVQIIFGTSEDTDFFLDKESARKNSLPKPVLYCSDAHDLSAIGSKTTWIKADPTFQGLKQCIYEPELRVAIQETYPENKTVYEVIDSIEFKSQDIGNSKLELNPYLNTVIGGRSTGKSILLRAIALKLSSSQLPSSNEYNDYANTIAENMDIIWKDKRQDNSREIEYFYQGFIHDYAKDTSGTKLTEIIEDILHKKGNREIFSNLDLEKYKISSNISQLVDAYFRSETQLLATQKQVLENGDKQGIETEIENLKKSIKENTPNSLTEAEQSEYEDIVESIEKSNAKINHFKSDLAEINKIKNFNFIENSIDGELLVCSDSLKQDIKAKYETLRTETEEKWHSQIKELKESEESRINREEESILLLNENENYKKGLKILTGNSLLTELNKVYGEQVLKLDKILKLVSDKRNLEQRKEELLGEIKSAHELFFSTFNSCLPNLKQTYDSLEILPRVHFDGSNYTEMLKARINLQSFEHQKLVEFNYKDYESFQCHIFDILDRLLNKKITLKSGVDAQEFSKTLLSHFFPTSDINEFRRAKKGTTIFG